MATNKIDWKYSMVSKPFFVFIAFNHMRSKAEERGDEERGDRRNDVRWMMADVRSKMLKSKLKDVWAFC